MNSITTLKKKWLKDPKISKAFEDMEPEFEVAHALIAARVEAGLTQEEVAKRMGTTQSVVARLEGGRTLPSLKSLYRYAKATGTKPVIHLVHN
jgi:DNA-binding XRE family transcriptional regulator